MILRFTEFQVRFDPNFRKVAPPCHTGRHPRPTHVTLPTMGCGSSSPVSEWDAALPPPKEAPKEAPIPTKEWAGDDEYNSLLADAKAFEATGDKTNEDY